MDNSTRFSAGFTSTLIAPREGLPYTRASPWESNGNERGIAFSSWATTAALGNFTGSDRLQVVSGMGLAATGSFGRCGAIFFGVKTKSIIIVTTATPIAVPKKVPVR